MKVTIKLGKLCNNANLRLREEFLWGKGIRRKISFNFSRRELIQRFIKRSSNEEILKKSERNCRRRWKTRTTRFSVHDVLMLRLVPLKSALITRNFRCIDRNCSSVSNVVRWERSRLELSSACTPRQLLELRIKLFSVDEARPMCRTSFNYLFLFFT